MAVMENLRRDAEALVSSLRRVGSNEAGRADELGRSLAAVGEQAREIRSQYPPTDAPRGLDEIEALVSEGCGVLLPTVRGEVVNPSARIAAGLRAQRLGRE